MSNIEVNIFHILYIICLCVSVYMYFTDNHACMSFFVLS